MTLDNLIEQLQNVRAVNGNISIQLLDLYAGKQRKGKRSTFVNDIHISYAEEEPNEPMASAPHPIGFV